MSDSESLNGLRLVIKADALLPVAVNLVKVGGDLRDFENVQRILREKNEYQCDAF